MKRQHIDLNKEKVICNWCNQTTTIIWVHGHGQCALCGINIDECCRGEQCGFENSPSNSDSGATDEK